MVHTKRELVDIRTVSIDRMKPKSERLLAYVRQIHDPYHFKCGKVTISASFTVDGFPMQSCMRQILR